ncbi:MAG: SAF domain-containing protein [Acidimicrobiia bacterium]
MTEPAIAPEEAPTNFGSARRSLVSRLSIGHVVMILAGLVAIVLNLAFLRSDTEPISVAVADQAIEAGTVLTDNHIGSVEVGDAGELVQGLLTEDAATPLLGSLLARDIAAGEPIRRSDLRPAGSSLALREYSIEVDAAEAAGGSIQGTDVVDIIAVIDNRAFYVAAGLEVVRVKDGGSGGDLIIVLSVDDQTALEIASARAAGSIAVVRSTGAPPPVSGPVTVDPTPSP